MLITNPDMLHTGILPHHPRWAALFANLRWVVLDELHVYRGVFGSHVANVLRRLRRICRFYGAAPAVHLHLGHHRQPQELAEKLIEAPVTADAARLTARRAPRSTVILYNPPVIDPAWASAAPTPWRPSASPARSWPPSVQTAVFARARATTEVLLGYVRDEPPAAAAATPRRCAATAAATCRSSGARSSAACATARCAAWWPPTRSSWAWTSASWGRR